MLFAISLIETARNLKRGSGGSPQWDQWGFPSVAHESLIRNVSQRDILVNAEEFNAKTGSAFKSYIETCSWIIE